MTRIAFEVPLIGWLVPLVAVALLLLAWSFTRRGLTRRQVAVLIVLRMAGFALLLVLAARPVWVESVADLPPRDEVILLVDRSESMSLRDHQRTRYREAVEFARDVLLPELKAARLRVKPVLFAEEAEIVDGKQLAEAAPNGRQTNLARAIVRSVVPGDRPPLAVVALTDGAATQTADNARAVSALVENQVPFVGIGFGSEIGSRVLSLEQATAPSTVAPNERFQISVQLRATGTTEMPGFDLVLLRDGQLAETKRIPPAAGARIWQESFSRTESVAKPYTYSVRLLPPGDSSVKCSKSEASVAVRVADESELRVLYLQGGLTWDYKFIRLALVGDPTIRLSALSRAASDATFFQNVENDADLVGGFPSTIEGLASFRVVVLSNLKPGDLTRPQQELLTSFCGEYGGGVLMIGGASTFNASWQDSQLEQLLPVRFSQLSGRGSPEAPFRLKIVDTALRSPVFQLSDEGDNRAAWASLPTFSQYAAVDSVKPGAQVWIEHPSASGPGGHAPLMVTQRFGTGTAGVICVQNFWRWRLAKRSDTARFDRFWRQLLRYLGDGGSDSLLIHLRDQQLRPNADIHLVVERRPRRERASASREQYVFRVADENGKTVIEQDLELRAGQTADVKFRCEASGLYSTTVSDRRGKVQARRSVDIQEVADEFVRTERNLEGLRQWANLSDGVALKQEECRGLDNLIDQFRINTDAPEQPKPRTVPAGINGWTMLLLFGCLCTEWVLRKRWGLA